MPLRRPASAIKRDLTFRVRLTADEQEALQRIVDHYGKCASQLVREWINAAAVRVTREQEALKK